MDRISGLSDELLLKILMLVPTEVAVSTSILSKRWEYLWMWLPKLDYCQRLGSGPDCERLRCFLDRNLPLHRAPVIESFRLECYDPRFKPKNISMWVLTAVTMLLDVPRMVSLPSLKTLKLHCVIYFDDKTLQRLLSNCPILEDLVVDLREYDTTRELTVVVPSLQSLSLYLPYNSVTDGYVIETPNLKYFKLRHNRNDHYCLIKNTLHLVEAYLDFNLPDLKSLIGSITSVKHLAICSEAMCDEGLVFDQLEHLEDHDHIPDGMEDWNQPSTVPECMLSSLHSLS
uniref:F-box domain-containing protein n=2 Tax=Brassica oleracea TaxID=3712 RepID=A0A0D3DTC9_BRAOL|nr:unnamed protein product [Brassica oleracea]